jgi:choline dehydrogenase-like flavoprotein
MAGLKIVGEVLPHPDNRVELAEEPDALGLPLARVTFGYGEDDRKLTAHARRLMAEMLRAAGGADLFETTGTAHLMGGCPMGASHEDGVVDGAGRAWDCDNLWICDGSTMPTGGGVNPSLTIMANAERIADRIIAAGRRGELARVRTARA